MMAGNLCPAQRPPMHQSDKSAPALPAPVSLCLEVEDIDGLHQRLTQHGWRPFTPVAQMPDPTGGQMRIFCIRTEENILLELVEAPSQ